MIIKIIIIIWLHFISDFILQSDGVAVDKSENVQVRLWHGFIYSIPFFFFGWEFAVLIGLSHFVVDFITSKLTKYYYGKNRHTFFIVIGCDQAIHMTILVITLFWLNCDLSY